MKIIDMLRQEKPSLSFEVFPPKAADKYDSVEAAAAEIAKLKPSFMSITYGAGGGTSQYTVDIASTIQNTYHVNALAHLTCVSSTREHVRGVLDRIRANGLENVLALRGDLPENGVLSPDYRYASQLIREIKEYAPELCIGAACYPEGHVESANKAADIGFLKEKVDAGCEFVTTQMFFDNNILYNYMYRIRERGVTVPVVAGIMPVTNAEQITRICKLSGTYLPARFKAIVDRFGDNPAAMQQAGIAYATEQIIDLIANGINGIHVYSMNKPEVARAIKESLSEIL